MQLATGDEGVILLCGRYEGIDERLIERCDDEEISMEILCCPVASCRRWC